ncbi:MAG: MOSC N-terminal beta barrel domain-containing protein [Pyrinomonadaceae bacterium]
MHISEINIYPIKSLKGIAVESALVEQRGLQYDRRWMLTTERGMFFTQREFPSMATITTEVRSGGLRVSADGFGGVSIPFEPDRGEHMRVTVWQSICDAHVYLGAVSEWFSDVLKTKCQLVLMPDSSKRHINPLFDHGDDIVSFADGYPLMVLSEASLEDLNGRLAISAEKAEIPFQPLPMNRFRPNLVVSGSDAFAEDDWRTIRIGEAMFRSTKPCARCVITTVDQAKGEFNGKEPLKTLSTYRLAKQVMPDRIVRLGLTDTSVLFGQNLVAENPGAMIRIADMVEVVERF